MTDTKQIKARIESTNQVLSNWRRTRHKIRRLVAGDISVLQTDTGRSTAQETDMSGQYKPVSENTELYDFLIQDVEEGRQNKLKMAVRILAQSVSHVFPDIEFEGVDEDIAAVNALYCTMRMGGPPHGCSARHQMRAALVDYIIGGLGAVFVGVRDGAPVVDSLDILDVSYDLTAKTFDQMQWVAYRQRQPLYRWVGLYGKPKLAKIEALRVLLDSDEPSNMDKPIAMVQYYDIHGKGTHATFYGNSADSVDETPVQTSANPFEIDGLPILPCEFMYFMQLPSAKMPTSIAEDMLADQIALWATDRSIRDTLEVGRAYRECEEDAYDPKEFDRWRDGEAGEVLKRKSGKQAMVVNQAQEIPQTQLAYRDQREKGLIEASGINPYAAGSKVEGVSYAAEVNAIQGNAGLNAASIAKDNAEFWQRVVRKFVAAAKYDDRPIKLILPGDQPVPIQFDALNPVNKFLAPYADIIVREDSLRFQPKEQEIAGAMNDIEVALKVSAMFPLAVREAFAKYIRARGERNPNAWMKPPEPQPIPMGMPGQMPQGQMAADTMGAA